MNPYHVDMKNPPTVEETIRRHQRCFPGPMFGWVPKHIWDPMWHLTSFTWGLVNQEGEK